MDDDSSDGGGLLLWIGLGVALVVGAGAFMWLRVGPARPPSGPVVSVPVTTSVSAPARTPVADGDLAWAKDAGVSLVVAKREVKSAANGVYRWIFSIELRNGGANVVDVQQPSEMNTWLETRAEGTAIVVHGTRSEDASIPSVPLEPGKPIAATIGTKFTSALQGEGRLVHLDVHKDGTRASVASDWFPLDEAK